MARPASSWRGRAVVARPDVPRHDAHGRRSRALIVAVACMAALVAGCARATPYQPYGGGRGYDDRRLGDGHFAVRFTANARTTRDTVMAYLLYRCAELAIANGYRYFETRGGISVLSMPTFALGGATVAFADVWMFSAPPDPDAPGVHEAARVLRALGPRIGRP